MGQACSCRADIFVEQMGYARRSTGAEGHRAGRTLSTGRRGQQVG
jgi:hypothetical protein